MLIPCKLTIAAPAKLNLHLAVLDKRPDGFHNLESIFLAMDFGDTLHFESADGEKTIEIVMEGPAADGFFLPMEKNIIFRAVFLFREKTGFIQGLKIRVEKRIPPGGGLGGGSSNAASTLLALNELAGFLLNREELKETAAILGSDVPFFIYKTPAAWVTGRGEYIEPLEALPWFFLLVNPGFPSSTAEAFRLLEEFRKSSPPLADKPGEKSITANQRLVASDFFNDFLPVFTDPEKSIYNEIISQLRELGADYASLSGAGSTCFGVFQNKTQAEKAQRVMRSVWDFVVLC
jgi:4-diphosphocytidyl-2-C-methyl-D-erythritol kinase